MNKSTKVLYLNGPTRISSRPAILEWKPDDTVALTLIDPNIGTKKQKVFSIDVSDMKHFTTSFGVICITTKTEKHRILFSQTSGREKSMKSISYVTKLKVNDPDIKWWTDKLKLHGVVGGHSRVPVYILLAILAITITLLIVLIL